MSSDSQYNDMNIKELSGSPRLDAELCRSRAELERVVSYFYDADDAALRAMGVERARLPERNEWLRRMASESEREPCDQNMCFVVWRRDGRSVGHSSMSRIAYREEGYAHLHMWDESKRGRGFGTVFMQASIDIYVQRFSLKRVISEPYADNPGPNKLLPKLGFVLVKRYRTIPGVINFEQDVNRWQLTTPQKSPCSAGAAKPGR